MFIFSYLSSENKKSPESFQGFFYVVVLGYIVAALCLAAK